jgi:prolyl oligopeptidase
LSQKPIAFLALSTLLASTLIAHPAQAAPPPVAEVRNVPTTLHGSTVNDPYRWLEDAKSPTAQSWMRSQGDATRTVLDRIDGRDAIAQRLQELSRAEGDAVRGVVRMPGDRYFYLVRKVGERQFKLVRREGVDGAEQVLVNPEDAARRTGVPHAVNFFMPSWDGRHLAYGMSAGGSEDASLHVIEVASGKTVGAPIRHVFNTDIHWLPDSRSFTFTQLAQLKPGAPETDTYKDARVMWLRLGGKPRPVFGPTVTRQLGLERLDVGEIITAPDSRWMVARTTDTTVPEGKMFFAPLATLGQAKTPWQRVASEADKVVSAQLQGDNLVVLLQAGAPRRKLVALDLRQAGQAGLASATLRVAEPKDGVLEGFALTPGGLVTELRQGTNLVLRRHDGGDTVGRTLPAPAAGTAWLASAPAHDTQALLYSFSGWTEPSRLYRLDGDLSVAVALGRRAVPPGLPDVQVTEVQVPSHDGVLVPMTILHRKGLAQDGRNAVLLEGYGSYGFSTSAFFSIANMVWIERGGVLAFLNPRGSGVYGDEWHRAGFKTTKPNTWKDGIAAAKYLIAKGYGSAKTMGISGTSAGGIFVGRATTEAPELFAAAIYNVGSLDTVRGEETANGATNVSEFGTVKDPAEFKALLEMSTYHAIKDGTAYPGVLLVHGMNDPRVEVWNSAKTAARLQAAQAANPDARPALLRLDMQAGHGVGSTLTQRQAQEADVQSFLLWQMGKLGLKD